LGSRLRGSDEEFWAIKAIGGSYFGDDGYVSGIQLKRGLMIQILTVEQK
jgi:hypothetical protein